MVGEYFSAFLNWNTQYITTCVTSFMYKVCLVEEEHIAGIHMKIWLNK